MVNSWLQEAEELQREMQAPEAERAGLLRDVRLKKEMEQQYAKRGTLQVGGCGWRMLVAGYHCGCMWHVVAINCVASL